MNKKTKALSEMFFLCRNCLSLQEGTEFGMCMNCDYEELMVISEEVYDCLVETNMVKKEDVELVHE